MRSSSHTKSPNRMDLVTSSMLRMVSRFPPGKVSWGYSRPGYQTGPAAIGACAAAAGPSDGLITPPATRGHRTKPHGARLGVIVALVWGCAAGSTLLQA